MRTPAGCRYQFTVTDYGSFALTQMLPLHDRPVFNCEEKEFFRKELGPTYLDKAKSYLEGEALRRNVFMSPIGHDAKLTGCHTA